MADKLYESLPDFRKHQRLTSFSPIAALSEGQLLADSVEKVGHGFYGRSVFINNLPEIKSSAYCSFSKIFTKA